MSILVKGKSGRGLLALVLGLTLVLALAQPALAGLKVVGAKIEAEVSPGSEHTYNIQVIDNSDDPMDIAVEVKGFGVSAEGALEVLEPEEDISPYSAREFLTVSVDSFHLEPQESQDITVTAQIPEKVGDGGRYAVVFIHTVPPPGGFAVITAIAVPVIFTIGGTKLTRDSEVTGVIFGEVTPGEPLEAIVTLANKGNYHYKPQVEASIEASGKEVATCAPVANNHKLIPGYSRQFNLDFTADKPLTSGIYDVEIEVRDEEGELITRHNCDLEVSEVEQLTPEPTLEPTSKPVGEPTSESASGQVVGIILGVAAALGLLAYFLLFIRAPALRSTVSKTALLSTVYKIIRFQREGGNRRKTGRGNRRQSG